MPRSPLDVREVSADSLVPLMGSKDIAQVPVMCQHLLMQLMRFNHVVEHVPGKSLAVADTLSMSPLPNTEDDEMCTGEVVAYVESIKSYAFSATKLN